jgi:hypothetical protein
VGRRSWEAPREGDDFGDFYFWECRRVGEREVERVMEEDWKSMQTPKVKWAQTPGDHPPSSDHFNRRTSLFHNPILDRRSGYFPTVVRA